MEAGRSTHLTGRLVFQAGGDWHWREGDKTLERTQEVSKQAGE